MLVEHRIQGQAFCHCNIKYSANIFHDQRSNALTSLAVKNRHGQIIGVTYSAVAFI